MGIFLNSTKMWFQCGYNVVSVWFQCGFNVVYMNTVMTLAFSDKAGKDRKKSKKIYYDQKMRHWFLKYQKQHQVAKNMSSTFVTVFFEFLI
jgi:hypothetical protein